MSREFGCNTGLYFHDKIQACKRDLEHDSSNTFHRKFIPLFEELYFIAFAISSVEACDRGPERSIVETIKRMPRLRDWVKDMDSELKPFIEVASEAVRRELLDE